VVTAPILRLAATAQKIAEDNDYSVRADKAGTDEVGTLTDAFNQMLAQIHAQDSALQIAHQELQEQLASLEREVAERKAAEEALRQSQEKLLETSRLAGKAEVATSVLHNVGNVLNSVNVSGNVLNERLRGSKVAVLAKASELINEHRTNFAEFVANDPRGQRIPDLVSKISEALAEEQKELLAEVGQITSHIGHIKEIVAMQQNYSRVGGVIEQLAPESLVEDALRMNAASLARHHVEVLQDFETVPKVQVDRHKALQILVNLLSNAKHAVDDSGREDKRVTVKIQNNGGHFVKISVEDNGVGIAPENLSRIFAHGFTTKKTGHGFGLHSGALTATELGGTLRAHSDGPGTGAKFTLELPITAPAAASGAN
jgi:C4-dicarboxylate-specific signal transduction histidine kinase